MKKAFYTFETDVSPSFYLCLGATWLMPLDCSKGRNNSWWRKYREREFAYRGVELNNTAQDSVSVENALYADPRLSEVAVVGVPDKRLGELVAAVVSVKSAFRGQVTEKYLIAVAAKTFVSGFQINFIVSTNRDDSLPRFAVPVMIVTRNEPFGTCSCFSDGSAFLT